MAIRVLSLYAIKSDITKLVLQIHYVVSILCQMDNIKSYLWLVGYLLDGRITFSLRKHAIYTFSDLSLHDPLFGKNQASSLNTGIADDGILIIIKYDFVS